MRRKGSRENEKPLVSLGLFFNFLSQIHTSPQRKGYQLLSIAGIVVLILSLVGLEMRIEITFSFHSRVFVAHFKACQIANLCVCREI